VKHCSTSWRLISHSWGSITLNRLFNGKVALRIRLARFEYVDRVLHS